MRAALVSDNPVLLEPEAQLFLVHEAEERAVLRLGCLRSLFRAQHTQEAGVIQLPQPTLIDTQRREHLILPNWGSTPMERLVGNKHPIRVERFAPLCVEELYACHLLLPARAGSQRC